MADFKDFNKKVQRKVNTLFGKGKLTVEDLYDLDVKFLDSLYQLYTKKLKDSSGDSLLSTKNKGDEELKLKIDLVKYVVESKLLEKESREKRVKLKQDKQKLLEILEQKQDEELRNQSVEDIRKKIEELDSV